MNNVFIGILFILMIAGFLFAVIPWIFSFVYEGIFIFLESIKYRDLKINKKLKTRKALEFENRMCK